MISGRFVILQGTQPVRVREESHPGVAVACAGLPAAVRAVQTVGLSSQTH